MDVLMDQNVHFAWKWSMAEKKYYRTIWNHDLGTHRWRERLIDASEDILTARTCRKMGYDLG